MQISKLRDENKIPPHYWTSSLYFSLFLFFCRMLLLIKTFCNLDKMDRAMDTISANQLPVCQPRHFLLNSQSLRLLFTNNSNLCRFQTLYYKHTHPRYCCPSLLLLQISLIIPVDFSCLDYCCYFSDYVEQYRLEASYVDASSSYAWTCSLDYTIFLCFSLLFFPFPFSFLHSIPQSRWWQLWLTVNPPTLTPALPLTLQPPLLIITSSFLPDRLSLWHPLSPPFLLCTLKTC